MLRQNTAIKGIQLIEMEIMLSQFPDDTMLCLGGTEPSFNESIIHTLYRFARISGLNMNNDNT